MGKKKEKEVRAVKYLKDGIVDYHSESLHVSNDQEIFDATFYLSSDYVMYSTVKMK